MGSVRAPTGFSGMPLHTFAESKSSAQGNFITGKIGLGRRMAALEFLEAISKMNAEVEKVVVEKDEAEKSGALSAIILAALVVLVSAFCVAYGLQTLVWVEARQWASVNPWLRDVPQPLPSSTSSATPGAKGTQVRAYDYEFISPWGAGKVTPYL